MTDDLRPEWLAIERATVTVAVGGDEPDAEGTAEAPGIVEEPAAPQDAGDVFGRFHVLAPIARIVRIPEIKRAWHRSPQAPRPLPHIAGEVMDSLGGAALRVDADRRGMTDVVFRPGGTHPSRAYARD